jgi:lysozyme
MRRGIMLAVLLLAAGCTSSQFDPGNFRPTAGESRAPRFADRDPHDWQDRAPWTYPVHGTDVSKYQGPVDWRATRASGVAFAYVKATEGGDRVDDSFSDNWRGAKAAGVPRGAYHFFYFCRPAAEQAAWFIANVPNDPTALPPVLDMEWNPASPTCKLRPSPEIVHAEMKTFLDIVGAHYGKRPIVYTSVDFYDDNGLHDFHGYHWWLRSVAAHPHDRYDNREFLFWQYTGTGIVPGIDGDADINVFHGSTSQWRDWLRKATQ